MRSFLGICIFVSAVASRTSPALHHACADFSFQTTCKFINNAPSFDKLRKLKRRSIRIHHKPMNNPRAHINQLVEAHEAYRRQTLNLIASENALSPAVRRVLQSDLVNRYGDYTGRDLSARRYRGNRHLEAIERQVDRIARDTFHAEYVELRPVSGHIAGAAVLMGLCKPGDTILEPGRDAGGHREGGKLALSPTLPLNVQYLPFDAPAYNIDVGATLRMIEMLRPRIVILGSSNFLFPHPVAEIAAGIKRDPSLNTILVYDASHVMGLIAAGRFQDPLREGADIVFGSTHKTLPGPQGGLIFTNRADLMERVSEATYPALVTNHHPFRMPALALALLEMQTCGAAYADQITQNSQALGAALQALGVPCVNAQGHYSASHTLLACVHAFGLAGDVAAQLEEAGIITTSAHLPAVWGTEGIRIGVQEVTRLGATVDDMARIAGWMADALTSARPIAEIAGETAQFASQHGAVQFTWQA
jgi:glycine hydroxymethyltransferase